MTKSKQIIAYKEANPTHKPSDVAKACGVTTAYVYQVLHADKRKKAKPVATPPTAGQKVLRDEIQRLNSAIERWESLSKFQDARIGVLTQKMKNLKDHHNGLEYVISYLESRLGIESKDDGATV